MRTGPLGYTYVLCSHQWIKVLRAQYQAKGRHQGQTTFCEPPLFTWLGLASCQSLDSYHQKGETTPTYSIPPLRALWQGDAQDMSFPLAHTNFFNGLPSLFHPQSSRLACLSFSNLGATSRNMALGPFRGPWLRVNHPVFSPQRATTETSHPTPCARKQHEISKRLAAVPVVLFHVRLCVSCYSR